MINTPHAFGVDDAYEFNHCVGSSITSERVAAKFQNHGQDFLEPAVQRRCPEKRSENGQPESAARQTADKG
jgi:hypothetical protein